jgi:hypothetical protein
VIVQECYNGWSFLFFRRWEYLNRLVVLCLYSALFLAFLASAFCSLENFLLIFLVVLFLICEPFLPVFLVVAPMSLRFFLVICLVGAAIPLSQSLLIFLPVAFVALGLSPFSFFLRKSRSASFALCPCWLYIPLAAVYCSFCRWILDKRWPCCWHSGRIIP